MSRAKRRTRNASRKRAAPGLNGTVHTRRRTESVEGPGTSAHGKGAGEGAAPARAALHEERVPPAPHAGAPGRGETAATAAAQDEPVPGHPAAGKPAPQPARALRSRPDTPAPDTPAPDTPAPDTPAPDGSAPDTPVPDGSVPDTPVPDTPVPDGSVRDGSVPDTSVPEGSVPDTSAPDMPVPDGSLRDAASRSNPPTARDTFPYRRPARGPSPRPRAMRMRISEAAPWSVTVMSFLLLGGLGVLTVVASAAAWGLAAILAPDALPRLSTFLTIAFTVITLEVVLGSCLAALTTFLYNLTAPYNGGLEISLTDDLGPTEAGANAQLAIDRAGSRARRYLRARTPAWVTDAVRHLSARCGSLRGRKPPEPSEHAVPVRPDAGQGE